jgi:endo-1,4-beta-xylanase
MWELGARVSSSHIRQLGRWFRLPTALVLALSCAGGDAGTLLGPVSNPLDFAVVQVTPDAVTIPSGASYQFTAVAILPGSVAIVPDVIWTATGGTITSSGVFTAGTTPGTYQISAQLRGHTPSGSAPVKVAPTLTSLILNPAAVTLAKGAAQQFAVAGTWSDGSAAVPAVTYTVAGGSITSSGLYTAGTTPGTFSVIATQQGGSKADTAIVNIAAPAVILLQMVLTPASVALAPAGTAQFSVAGTWSDGSSSAPAVTYSATGGTITAGGVYTAGATAGTYRVIAAQTGGTNVDTSVVTINAVPPTLTQMTLSPTSLALAPGAAGQFSVAGTWSDGSSSAPAVAYSATGGTINAAGLYMAGTSSGTFRVIATQQGGTKVDTVAVTITASAPTLAQMVLSPASLSLAAGATGQFSVTGTWSDGTTTAPAVTYSATGGSISARGLYTAGTTPGSFRVIATQQGGTKVDTAVVTITALPPTLAQMVLSPASLSVTTGTTGQFSVTGTWSDGTSTAPAVTYSATGGTISAAGLYTASTTAGTFRVIATQQGGTKVDTAVVTITAAPPTLTQMVLSPASLSVTTGTTGQFSVTGTWSDGTSTAPAVTYSATGGTITATGQYTAGTTPGTFSVNATQKGGTKVDTSVVTISTNAPSTLRALATGRNFLMGTSSTAWAVSSDSQYRRVLTQQYNSIATEYDMDFPQIHPAETQYSFAAADQLVAFAVTNAMTVHGHSLVWHYGLPIWITGSAFTKTKLLSVLKDHVTTVVGHYKGQVGSWDVVNEVLADDGLSMRSSIWYNTIGPEYIDSAFVWAHRADPAAKLYLNDWGAEWLTPKADSVLGLMQSLRARGVPIDGVGFETHFSLSAPDASSVRANLARFAAAGFLVRISEMDVRIPDGAATVALNSQGAIYRDVLDACLRLPQCTGLTSWGFTDAVSWIPSYWPGFGRGLPFDLNYQPKPAFDSLVTRLRQP